MEGLHFDVIEATLKSIQTQSITPIVKEELKLKIQSSRLAAGKEELPKTVFKEPQKYELTEEEQEKRRIKRERNRVAAEKCRKKKKVKADSSVQELQALQKKNDELNRQVTLLQNEIRLHRDKLTTAGIFISTINTPEEKSASTNSSLTSTQTTPTPHYFQKSISPTFSVPSNHQNVFFEMVQATPEAYCVQNPFSGNAAIPIPQRRFSHDDVINHVTPVAPPCRPLSADPYFCYPSTSSAFLDMPQQLCETRTGELDSEQFDSRHNDFAELNIEFGDHAKMEELVDDIDVLLGEPEEEALVPGHHFDDLRESPSFY